MFVTRRTMFNVVTLAVGIEFIVLSIVFYLIFNQ